MTYKDVADMVESIGLDFAYYEFQEAAGQSPPFILFYFPERRDIIADDSNYCKKEQLIIELYTDTKDFEKEAAVEAVLEANGFVYSRAEQFIETERMYEVIFSTEVFING
jgi:hypothetical protein